MNGHDYQVQVYENSDQLAQAFAELFLQRAAQAIQDNGRFHAVLSGGSTPLKGYQILRESSEQTMILWEHVHLYWGDERHVPYEDEQSNFGQARKALLDHVGIPAQNLHPIRTDLPPEETAQAYHKTLVEFADASGAAFWFDLVILGLGEDGHTASLFPGQSGLWAAPVIPVSVEYQSRISTRITLTPITLNKSKEVVFLVQGASKANALATALTPRPDIDRYPSQAIQPAGDRLIWMVDAEAASQLPPEILGAD